MAYVESNLKQVILIMLQLLIIFITFCLNIIYYLDMAGKTY